MKLETSYAHFFNRGFGFIKKLGKEVNFGLWEPFFKLSILGLPDP